MDVSVGSKPCDCMKRLKNLWCRVQPMSWIERVRKVSKTEHSLYKVVSNDHDNCAAASYISCASEMKHMDTLNDSAQGRGEGGAAYNIWYLHFIVSPVSTVDRSGEIYWHLNQLSDLISKYHTSSSVEYFIFNSYSHVKLRRATKHKIWLIIWLS